MFADEGDELLIGDTEYIVLNKYTEDGKEYLFEANILNPEENIADNFDTDAVKMLLLSQEELIQNSKENDVLKNFLNSYVEDDSFEKLQENNDYTIYGDSKQYFTSYHQEDEEYEKKEESKTTSFFNVEKHMSKLERILEIMFLM